VVLDRLATFLEIVVALLELSGLLASALGVALQGFCLVAILASEVEVELPFGPSGFGCGQPLQVACLLEQFATAIMPEISNKTAVGSGAAIGSVLGPFSEPPRDSLIFDPPTHWQQVVASVGSPGRFDPFR
jgi:hypothetical protein